MSDTRSGLLTDPSRQSLAVEQSFDYVIKRQRRKTIAVHVLPDASVEVRAPKWVPKYELMAFVEQRSDWIIRQRQKSLAKLKTVPRFEQGQQHGYLGQRYRLDVSSHNRAKVEWVAGASADGAYWKIHVRDPANPSQIQAALERWYRQQAQVIFSQRMQQCYSRFPPAFQNRYPQPDVVVRKMRRRWGSCSSKGVVTLNLLLIKMPLECIDYVIVHELCHLQEFHHGKAFYALLASILPRWRELELTIERLSGNG